MIIRNMLSCFIYNELLHVKNKANIEFKWQFNDMII